MEQNRLTPSTHQFTSMSKEATKAGRAGAGRGNEVRATFDICNDLVKRPIKAQTKLETCFPSGYRVSWPQAAGQWTRLPSASPSLLTLTPRGAKLCSLWKTNSAGALEVFTYIFLIREHSAGYCCRCCCCFPAQHVFVMQTSCHHHFNSAGSLRHEALIICNSRCK